MFSIKLTISLGSSVLFYEQAYPAVVIANTKYHSKYLYNYYPVYHVFSGKIDYGQWIYVVSLAGHKAAAYR